MCMHVRATLCACVFAMICMKTFVNFCVLYTCNCIPLICIYNYGYLCIGCFSLSCKAL